MIVRKDGRPWPLDCMMMDGCQEEIPAGAKYVNDDGDVVEEMVPDCLTCKFNNPEFDPDIPESL